MRRETSTVATSDSIEKIPNDVGQGERLNTQPSLQRNDENNGGNKGLKPVLEASRVVAADIKRNLTLIKDKLMGKLSAAPVPAEALENVRHFVESVIRDVANAAQGLTKDALQRIKNHLTEILPSLSPQQTAKMMEDAEEEAMGASKGEEDDVSGSNQRSPRSKL
ncbi:uncharacterized protein [Aristolochia californica]|uniref:uncharacterized protein n=1 Tax=Aristolochia californica TaxID=171875 RepID=UPI0035DDAD58